MESDDDPTPKSSSLAQALEALNQTQPALILEITSPATLIASSISSFRAPQMGRTIFL